MIPINATGMPFDDVRGLFHVLPGPDEFAVAAVRARNRELTKPVGSLGDLEAVVEWLAAWQGNPKPAVRRPLVVVFAGNHGVAAHGVSVWPQAVTRQMLDNFAAGGGAINQICASYDLGFKVFDLALDLPTGDITREAALDEKACVATMAFGMEAIAGGTDLLSIGEMGIGGTIAAAAVHAALYGGPASRWVARGAWDAGAADARIAAVEQALAFHAGHLDDPLEVLRRLGGREIAAAAGAILAARLEHIPVLLDGYTVTAAAAILHAVDPASIGHCMAGHLAAGEAHAAVLERLGKKPLLSLGLALGEGAGAALAAGIVKAAAACHGEMATFTQTGIERQG
ncbi:MAG: nicotinate-nucleotide--dimethylbenzimidazole phosphoribosyltransferase [Pseudochelatococcus sp.]|jgi:nicotinate-nucleotide--dimethylbenzimidazole phosphoribosyltransferase|uniref:nicotinate-nucleotide--dimethylbenzimidazole phosphoribosyltransferase n=1 Tax=Pseudochelatococcus sp. TaxID=2020869 RepID=UPI003D949424